MRERKVERENQPVEDEDPTNSINKYAILPTHGKKLRATEAIKLLHGTGFNHGSVEIYNVDLTTRNRKQILCSLFILWKAFSEKQLTPKFHTLEYDEEKDLLSCHIASFDELFKKNKIVENSKVNLSSSLLAEWYENIDFDDDNVLNMLCNDILFNFQYENIFYKFEYVNYLMSLNENCSYYDKIFTIVKKYLDVQNVDPNFINGIRNEIELKENTNQLLKNLVNYHRIDDSLDRKNLKKRDVSIFQYYRDIHITPLENTFTYETFLDRCCTEADSLIHGENSFLLDSPGINRSMFYINTTCGSVTPMHSEITDLPSVAYLVYGAPKIWIIVDECSSSDMKNMFIRKFNNSCAAPWEHQTSVFTLDELDEFHISYKIIIQYPNSLVTLKEGVFHQVINLGPNILEACNFAGIRWELLHKSRISQCLCLHKDGESMSKNVNIQFNSGAPIKVVQSKKQTYICQDEYCVSAFTTIHELEAHIRLIHPNKIPPNFQCLECADAPIFATKSNLLRHAKAIHSGKETCPNCNKRYGRLSYHLNKTNECSKIYMCVRGKIIKKNNK